VARCNAHQTREGCHHGKVYYLEQPIFHKYARIVLEISYRFSNAAFGNREKSYPGNPPSCCPLRLHRGVAENAEKTLENAQQTPRLCGSKLMFGELFIISGQLGLIKRWAANSKVIRENRIISIGISSVVSHGDGMYHYSGHSRQQWAECTQSCLDNPYG
jgi:hypothetical protein